MGNCGNKPLTTDEADVPEPEQKTTTVEERGTEVELNKDQEAKKPEAEVAAKPAEGKPSEPAKIEEIVARDVTIEAKTVEVPKPVAEPPKPVAEPAKPAAAEPAKPAATEPYKPAATELPKPAASEPKKEEIKAVVAPAAAPATVEKKVEEKKPVAN